MQKNASFKNLFSIAIGKPYAFQRRFIEFIGEYKSWNTSVKEGLLQLDDRRFDVEYIGTTSKSDNYWYSSELESVIPDQYVDLMIQTRKIIEKLQIPIIPQGKIELSEAVNGYNLSMIYIAFAPINTAYFNGSGDTSIYMFVKNLPENIFERLSNVEFPNVVMEIIGTFNVNAKLVVKSLASEFDYNCVEEDGNLKVLFSEKSQLLFNFNGENLEKITGTLA